MSRDSVQTLCVILLSVSLIMVGYINHKQQNQINRLTENQLVLAKALNTNQRLDNTQAENLTTTIGLLKRTVEYQLEQEAYSK